MKIKRNSKLSLVIAAGGLAALTPIAQAASFTYNIADLVLAFRQSGQQDLVVDIGQAFVYDAVPSGQTISVVNLATPLNSVYSSLDGLSWTVTGSERLTGASYPFQTVWSTAPRTDILVKTTTWNRQGQFAQAGPAGQIAAIGNNAATYSSLHPASALNTATLVAIPNNDQNAYTPLIQDPYNTSVGDVTGTFQGNVENTTPFDFDSGEPVSVSDLYELLPGSGTGKWVGYFSFNVSGAITFTAAVASAPAPKITAITRSGSVTSISFNSAASYTYSLLVTNQAGLFAPRSTWRVTGNSLTGTGGVLTFQNTNSSGTAFYAISVH